MKAVSLPTLTKKADINNNGNVKSNDSQRVSSKKAQARTAKPEDIFRDRRTQQRLISQSLCRRKEDRFGEVYDGKPWWLKVNYVTHHFASK